MAERTSNVPLPAASLTMAHPQGTTEKKGPAGSGDHGAEAEDVDCDEQSQREDSPLNQAELLFLQSLTTETQVEWFDLIWFDLIRFDI